LTLVGRRQAGLLAAADEVKLRRKMSLLAGRVISRPCSMSIAIGAKRPPRRI